MCNFILHFKVLKIPGSLLFSRKLTIHAKSHKFKCSARIRTNEASRKSMDPKSSSDKSSFYMSSDSLDSAGRTEGVSGTSASFQFWITKNLNLEATCPILSSDSHLKSHIPETLRKYELLVDNDSKTMENEANVKIKVMNYNVLSQWLLEQHLELYQKQEEHMLDWNFRKEILFDEFITVKPDILCLQEVQESEVSKFYNRLEDHGYKSVSKMKTSNKGDGLCLYYKAADVRLVEYDSVEYRQPGIIELENRDQVGLIARLEKGGKHFIVANTHLLYNPRRTDVRLAQVQMLLAEIHRMARKDEDDSVNVLLMGDFNSAPESPIINFIKNAKLLSHYRPLPLSLGISAQCTHMQKESKLYHTKKQNISPTEGHNESIAPASNSSGLDQSFTITHAFNFTSTYDLKNDPKRGVTTFQDEWIMVDYIFYSHGLKMISRLALPTSEEGDKYLQYLPNNVNPSDHLPLIAEFEIL